MTEGPLGGPLSIIITIINTDRSPSRTVKETHEKRQRVAPPHLQAQNSPAIISPPNTTTNVKNKSCHQTPFGGPAGLAICLLNCLIMTLSLSAPRISSAEILGR